LQSRISMPRTFVKFVAASLGAVLHCCRTGTVHESVFSSLPCGMVCVQWGDVMLSAFSLCWGLLAGAAQEYHFLGSMSFTHCSEKVLHGLLDIAAAEKTSLEKKCQFHWPCAGLTPACAISFVCCLVCLLLAQGRFMHQFLKRLVALQNPGSHWTQHATQLQKARADNCSECCLLLFAIRGPIEGASGAIKGNRG
jgi:hypothetical protein